MEKKGKTVRTAYSDSEFRQLIRDEARLIIREELTAILNNEGEQIGATSQEGYINAEQAAEFLKMKVSTIYDKTSKGVIPFIKKGKRVLFKKSELTAWLNSEEEK